MRLIAGALIADRYELTDLVSERFSALSWRAYDHVLTRSVGIQAIESSDPRVLSFTAAARASASLSDPRFLRVLDIREVDGYTLVVREWVKGFHLDQLLNESALSNSRSADLVSEVAQALSHAHASGVYHQQLRPSNVLLKENGAVRISSMATEAALAANPDHGPRGDIQALGKLLYACLTGRWPGSSTEGLPTAPYKRGSLLDPRQVSPKVSLELNDVCMQILNGQLTAAQEIVRALETIPRSETASGNDPVIVPSGPPPGLKEIRRPKAYDPPLPTNLDRTLAHAKTYTRGHKALIAIGVVGAIALASAMGVLAVRALNTAEPGSITTDPVLEFAHVSDFDPEGDGTENPNQTALAWDRNLETSWATLEYYNNRTFGGLKSGTGLIVDLGAPHDISRVRLWLGEGSSDVVVYAAKAQLQTPPVTTTGLELVGSAQLVTSTATFEAAVRTQYLVVWLTALPEVGPNTYRGTIVEISAQGKPVTE